jgi:hypothetical protein
VDARVELREVRDKHSTTPFTEYFLNMRGDKRKGRAAGFQPDDRGVRLSLPAPNYDKVHGRKLVLLMPRRSKAFTLIKDNIHYKGV